MVAIKSLTMSQAGVGALEVTMFCGDTLSHPQGVGRNYEIKRGWKTRWLVVRAGKTS